jgi:hypothetical protein
VFVGVALQEVVVGFVVVVIVVFVAVGEVGLAEVAVVEELLLTVVGVVVADGVVLGLVVVVGEAFEVVLLTVCGHVPGARSVRRVGVGVFGTLVLGAWPTVMVALPAPS